MIKQMNKKDATRKRHIRIRLKIKGTQEAPRLAVYRSLKHIYAQLIDDNKGVTLVSASSTEKEIKEKFSHGGNLEAAKAVGELLAIRAKSAGIEDCVFDRGGFLYHGRIAALADAAREGGLNF